MQRPQAFDPPLPMKLSARHWNASFRQMRSFRTELVMSRMNSSLCHPSDAVDTNWQTGAKEVRIWQTKQTAQLRQRQAAAHWARRTSLSRMEHAMYPTCFSAYLHAHHS